MPPARAFAAQCSAIITSTGPGDHDVRGTPVSLDQPLREQSACAPRRPSRESRAAGSAAATGPASDAGRRAAGGGSPGSRRRSHRPRAGSAPPRAAGPDRSRDCRIEVGPAARGAGRPRARGPGRRSTDQVGEPGDGPVAGRRVEPTHQLEVNGIRQGSGRWGSRPGPSSSHADQVVVPPDRRCSAHPATASSYDGDGADARTSGAQQPAQADDGAGVGAGTAARRERAPGPATRSRRPRSARDRRCRGSPRAVVLGPGRFEVVEVPTTSTPELRISSSHVAVIRSTCGRRFGGTVAGTLSGRWARTSLTMRLADPVHVGGPRELELAERVVEAAQHRHLGAAERGIGGLALGVRRLRVQPDHAREPVPQRITRSSWRRHRDQVHVLRRQVGAPGGEDPGQVLHPPEPQRVVLGP